MSFLGIKVKPLRLLGKVAKLAAPVLAATGVGIPLAAGLGAAGNVLDKGKRATVGGVLKTGAITAGAGLAGNLARGSGILGKAKAAIAGAPAGRGILGRIGEAIAKDPLKAAEIGLSGYTALQGAHAQSRSNSALDRALSSLGTDTTMPREDLSATFADEGNPYSQPRKNRALDAARASLMGAR